MKVNSKTLIEFHKRFANGEQFLNYDKSQDIIPEYSQSEPYQSSIVFNKLLPMVTHFKQHYKLRDKDLYGEDGFVSHCVPIQRAYNAVRNRKLECINRLSQVNLAVEDGSVDIDALENEGLTPGKVLVYRQGAHQPFILENAEQNKILLSYIQDEENQLENEFDTLFELFSEYIYYDKRKDKNAIIQTGFSSCKE